MQNEFCEFFNKLLSGFDGALPLSALPYVDRQPDTR